MGGAPKAQGPSQSELDARKKETERLEAERKSAELEEDRSRKLRINEQNATARRRRGRASLIKTGSELGTQSKLG